MGLGHIAFFKVAAIALGEFLDFAEAADSAGAVATVALVVPMSQSVLLLGVFDYF